MNAINPRMTLHGGASPDDAPERERRVPAASRSRAPSASRGRLSAALMLAAASVALGPRGAAAVEVEVSGDSSLKVAIRGFVATDINWDQHDLGGAEPFLPAPNDSPQAQNSAVHFSASQTQIGFGVQLPQHGSVSTDAYTEMDFLKGNITGPTEHIVSATPRLRLAFARFRWNDGNDTLVVGQTYSLFGDLWPDQTFDNLSLSLGTVLGREPQVQFTHLSALDAGSRMTYAVSVNAPNSGFWNQATGVAETASVPFMHAKIGYQNDRLGKADYYGFESHPGIPAQVNVSGFYGREKIPTVAGATKIVTAWGAALNGVLPIAGMRGDQRAGSASISGELWVGQQVDGYFGGNGQGVFETADGHVSGLRARGGFVEFKYFFTQRLNLNAIYSVDKNDLDKLVQQGTAFVIDSGLFSGTPFGAPGVNKAENINTALWYNPFDRCFFGLVWDYRKVDYNSGQKGSNNRANLSMFYNF